MKISYKAKTKCRNLDDYINEPNRDSNRRITSQFDVPRKSSKRLLSEDYPGIIEYCKKHDCSFTEAIKKLSHNVRQVENKDD